MSISGQGHVARRSGAPPAPALRWRREFPGAESELAALRRWLESLLPECPPRDDVAYVSTELGTNAVRHTASGRGGWFAVEITWHPAVVRVAVADSGAPEGPRLIDDPDGEHGRGLRVVEGLSVCTGVCGDHRGRLVWADVPWGGAGAEQPASPQDRYEAAIRDGQAGLASRFAGVSAWFGRSTLQWWALAGGELVAAPSAQELAALLGGPLDPAPSLPPDDGDTAFADARAEQRSPPAGGSAPAFSCRCPGQAVPISRRARVTGPARAGMTAGARRLGSGLDVLARLDR